MTAVSLAMEKRSAVLVDSNTEARRTASWQMKYTCAIVVCSAIVSIATGTLVGIFATKYFCSDCALQRNHPHEGAVVDELMVRRGALTQLVVRGQGLMLIDHEQQLKVLSFDNMKDVCFISKFDNDGNDLNTTGEENVMAVPVSDPANSVMYVTENQPVQPEIMSGFLRGICKTAYWMHVEAKDGGSETARVKRSCTYSCIIVCRPGGGCNRECVKNICRDNTPVFV